MEGVEGLYKKFGVLADAKDKAGEYEEEYLSILSTICNGSDAEKRLCASFIPRFFKSFPDHQEAAFNAQLDLCEEEEAVIRREAIKGLPDLCKADSNLIARMASVLAQLLPIEGHLDQTIVKHCLAQLIKQDSRATINGLFSQIVGGADEVKDAGKKFLLERIADSDRYFPTLQTDDTLRTYLIDQLDTLGRGGSYEEFVELMRVSAGIDRKKTVKVITKLMDLDRPFDPTDTHTLEHFCLLLPVLLKHHTKTSTTSHLLKFFGSVLPVFSQIGSPEHKILLLQGLAETLHLSVTEEDSALCLDGIYTLLFAYLPEEVPTEEEVESPQSLDFSVLECLLFALNKTGSQVPSYLKDEKKVKELTPKLVFVLRCCTCYAKRLKGSAIGEDTPEKVKLKTQAYKTCNNTKELARGLTSAPIVYKSDTNFSWKVDLTNVTNRLFTPLVSDSKKTVREPRPLSKSAKSPTPKRRRPSDHRDVPQRRSQQVYAPPQGKYSTNIGNANGKDDPARRERGNPRRY